MQPSCTSSSAGEPMYLLLPRFVLAFFIGASLASKIIDCKRSWNRPVAYPICVGLSVCLSVCLENIFWQNGCLDPDAV